MIPSDSPILDAEALEERIGGDSELLAEIIAIFLDRYPGVMSKLKQAAAVRDSSALEKAAHSLRGYLVNFHAQASSEVALELELKGRTGDLTDADPALARLEREIERLLPVLKKMGT
jgi:HPt (histidine-containing phosphotransfer) domain-containing protein